MSDLFPIERGEVLLRPITPEDAEAKRRIDEDSEVRKYLGTPSNLEDEIASFKRDGYGLVAIVERESGDVVGYGRLQRPDWNPTLGLELVVAIVPERRQKGLATDAARALVELGHQLLPECKVVARVNSTNADSLRLVEKLGMKKIDERIDVVSGHTEYIYVAQERRMALKNEDKLKAYVDLYKQQMLHYEKSQDVEWKGSFGVWTLLVGGVFLAWQNFGSENPALFNPWIALVIAGLPVLIHFFWLFKRHKFEEFDKKLWSRYRAEARTILLTSEADGDAKLPDDELEYQGLSFLDRLKWLVLEVGVTLGLALTLWFLLSFAS